MDEILRLLLENVSKLTDEELQAEFDACKDGPVGRAILGLPSK